MSKYLRLIVLTSKDEKILATTKHILNLKVRIGQVDSAAANAARRIQIGDVVMIFSSQLVSVTQKK